ncbi:MAG: NAD(P)-dependent oxidoreductase [Victivallales bacterium]|nr:NAD(P)-dependent oxidoreductase [Victivallales bacterium]
MNIFVTGGTGRIGRHVVKGLADHGFKLTSLDRSIPKEHVEGVNYVFGDINDFNLVMDHIKGADAVVHLAALPSPGLGSTREIMNINVLGAFKVFQAAVKNGVGKVVQASSINYLGTAFGVRRFRPQYFPIDEMHASNVSDAYSLSKKMDEDIADYFWHRDSLPSFSLRFPAVISREWVKDPRQCVGAFDKILSDLESLPNDRRMKYFEEVFEQSNSPEFSNRYNSAEKEGSEEQKYEWRKMGLAIKAMRGLFAYIEISDCVQSVLKALESDFKGSCPLYVNGPDTGRSCDTMRLIRIFFPEVKDIRGEIEGNSPLIDCSRARELIGFKPEFSLAEFKRECWNSLYY